MAPKTDTSFKHQHASSAGSIPMLGEEQDTFWGQAATRHSGLVIGNYRQLKLPREANNESKTKGGSVAPRYGATNFFFHSLLPPHKEDVAPQKMNRRCPRQAVSCVIFFLLQSVVCDRLYHTTASVFARSLQTADSRRRPTRWCRGGEHRGSKERPQASCKWHCNKP